MTDIEQYRPGFEAWARKEMNMPAEIPFNWQSEWSIGAFTIWCAAKREASTESADPMDWPLPCDVTVGAGTNKKGTSLRALVARMQMLHRAASAAFPGAQGGNTGNEPLRNPEGLAGALTDEAKDAVVAAARKLAQCKGRYHTEQNFKALADAVAAHTKAQEGA